MNQNYLGHYCYKIANAESQLFANITEYLEASQANIIALTGIKLSVDKVLDIAKTIATVMVHMPNNKGLLYQNHVPEPTAIGLYNPFSKKIWASPEVWVSH